jgi:DNA-binding MarR family transcriptional regulator
MSYFSPNGSNSFGAFALAVFDVNTALNEAGDALTKPVGQSSARWRILGRVSQGPQTVSQVAQRIGHARQSVQRIADDLVGLGLAEYVPNPNDQRAQLLQLTDGGRGVLAAIEAEQTHWTTRLAAVLDEEVLDKLTAGIGEVRRAIVADHERAFRAEK